MALSRSLSLFNVLLSTVYCPWPIIRTILLGIAVTPLVFALAIAAFLVVFRAAFRLEIPCFLEEDFRLSVRLDLSLLAPALLLLLLLLAFRLIVALLAPIVASSYVLSLTLTLLIPHRLNFVQ